MKAAVLHEFGGVPRYEDFPDPVAEDGEVLIEVEAVAVENVDKAVAAGTHFASGQFLPALPAVVAFDGIGTLPDGSLVGFAQPRPPYGALAQRTVVPVGNTTPAPEGIEPAVAVVISSAVPAFALRTAAGLAGGETVLIQGATGVAGRLAVQVARHTVTSADGVPIGYRSLGRGPGVVIVHGAMQSADSQRDLAALLAADFRVHLVDRRGRGASGPSPAGAATDVEVGDLHAVLATTGARAVLGISSGALIAARTALTDPRCLDRLALFEPPLIVDGSLDLAPLARVEKAAGRQQWATVLALGMKIAEMGPPWMFRLPVPVLAAFSRRVQSTPDGLALARALPVDLAIVRENAEHLADFAGLRVPTLLLEGTDSRPYLRRAVAVLAATAPGAVRRELAGLTHAATQNRDAYGHPDAVAPALLDFFRDR